MKFKTLFILLTVSTLAAATADFLLTWWSFRNYLMLHELNPVVTLLRVYGLTRIPALAVSFVISAAAILGGYGWVKDYLEDPPYSGDLCEVGRYLADLGNPEFRDLEIFAVIAIYGLFLCFHFVGIGRWVDIFVL